MDANRLAQIIKDYTDFKWITDPEVVGDLLVHIDHQQAEIERLNRAYEVLEIYVAAEGIVSETARRIREFAQRIKEGKDGEQG